jgi:hypothetical protein
MTKKQDNQDWIELCEYVKKDILKYDDEMKIPRYLILRLRGLAKGQFLANKNAKSNGDYSYKTILYTFKICKAKFLQCGIQYKDEKHKVNTLMMFIENEINDVVFRLNKTKDNEDKVSNLSLENQFNNGAEYKRKESKTIKNLDDLW